MRRRSEIKDFTQGNLTRHLVGFAVPVLLSHLMMILLNTVDMVVVGQKLGEAGTSAVSVGGSVAMLLNALIGGFASAAQVLIAMMIGAGERNRISRFVSTVCGFLFVFGVATTCVAFPLIHSVLELLNTPAEAYAGALAYAEICLIGVLPIYAYHTVSAVVRGMGDSRHPFFFIAFACGLNIVLDLVFVLLFDMGVGGAAVATVLAQLVSVIASVAFLVRKREAFALNIRMRDFVKWDKKELSRYVKLAVPMAINNSAIQVAAMVVGALVNGFGVSVSAFAGIRANIATTVDLILGSVAAAGAMIIGQNLAAGNRHRVNGVLLRVGAVSVTVAAVLAVAFLVFPETLFGIFTSDGDVLAIIRPYLPILMLSFAFAAIRPVTRALIDGSGNRRINLIAALLDAVVARVGFALVFGFLLSGGYMGLWFGVTVAELVPIMIGAVFYFSGAWKRLTYVPTNDD